MQLTGPPRLNDYLAPYCSSQTPLEAAWRDESVIVQGRTGQDFIRERRLRGRFVLEWRGIDYNTALRLLDEVSDGTCMLTPRTDAGGGGFLDLDGDGIPDVILEEVALPCRLVGPLPASSRLNAYVGRDGERVANVRLELQTRMTYPERPGLTQPVVTQFRHFHTQGSPDYTVTIGGMKGLVDFGDGQGFQEYNGTAARTIDASGGERLATLVFTSKTLSGFSMRTRAVTGDRGDSNNAQIYFSDDQDPAFGADFSGLSVEGGVDFDGNSGQSSVFGELSEERSFDKVTGLWNRGDLQTPPTAIKGAGGVENGQGWLAPSDVNLLPQNMNNLNFTGSGGFADNATLAAGGPLGPNTTVIRAQFGTNVVVDPDVFGSDQVGAAPTPARNLVEADLQTMPAGGYTKLLKATRKMRRYRHRFGDLIDEDMRGAGVVPASLTNFSWDSADFGGTTRMPDDWSFLQAQNCKEWQINSSVFDNNKEAITEIDGVKQFNWSITVKGFYSQRQFLQGDENVRIFRLDENNRAIYFSGWKTIEDMHLAFGLGAYHPDGTEPDLGLIDYVQQVGVATAFETPVSAVDATAGEIRLNRALNLAGTNDPTLEDWDKQGQKGGFKLRYNDTDDTVEAFVFDNGGGATGATRRWMPIFAETAGPDGIYTHDNRLIRLRGPSSDVQYQVQAVTYDQAAEEIVLTIDTAASRDGVSTDLSVAEVGSDALYAFFFYNIL